MLKVINNWINNSGTGLLYRGNARNYSSDGSNSLIATVKNYFASRDGAKPPYHHVCQIGDPALRLEAAPVDPEIIPTAEFQKFVNHLIAIMRKYEAFGLSASQIGSPVQLFVLETTEKVYKECIKSKSAGQPLEIIPLQIFINPTMKILDYKSTTYPECCASICGYSAHVPRANSIKINALDLSGKSFEWSAVGWPARIAQHEMDHLQGKLFTDKMNPKTLSCILWDVVNQKRGKIGINFSPDNRSKFRRTFYS